MKVLLGITNEELEVCLNDLKDRLKDDEFEKAIKTKRWETSAGNWVSWEQGDYETPVISIDSTRGAIHNSWNGVGAFMQSLIKIAETIPVIEYKSSIENSTWFELNPIMTLKELNKLRNDNHTVTINEDYLTEEALAYIRENMEITRKGVTLFNTVIQFGSLTPKKHWESLKFHVENCIDVLNDNHISYDYKCFVPPVLPRVEPESCVEIVEED